MAAVPRTMRVSRRATTTVSAMVVAAVVAAAAVASAAVVSIPAGEWGRAAAAVAGTVSAHLSVVRLSVLSRPLSPNVSVFTDGTYEPLPDQTPQAGCPTSLAIAGDLGEANNTFEVPASRVSIDGSACTGETPDTTLIGVYGAPLAEELAKFNASELLEVDPKLGFATSAPGSFKCGNSTWMGGNAAFVFLVIEDTPVAVYGDESKPARACLLAITEGTGAPPVATPTPA